MMERRSASEGKAAPSSASKAAKEEEEEGEEEEEAALPITYTSCGWNWRFACEGILGDTTGYELWL